MVICRNFFSYWHDIIIYYYNFYHSEHLSIPDQKLYPVLKVVNKLNLFHHIQEESSF